MKKKTLTKVCETDPGMSNQTPPSSLILWICFFYDHDCSLWMWLVLICVWKKLQETQTLSQINCPPPL